MRYIKLFEETKPEPQIGDYVLVDDKDLLYKIGRIGNIETDPKYSYPYTIHFTGDGIQIQNFSRDKITHWSKSRTAMIRALEQRLKEKQFDL